MTDVPTVKDAIFEKVVEVIREWTTLQTAIDEAQAVIDKSKRRQEELARVQDDCFAASRLFNFDLGAGYAEWREQRIASQAALGRVASPSSPPGPRRPVREVILEAAEKAYPNPVRASDLRKLLADQGLLVHEKTVGMTLYRLSRSGQMLRRKGTIDWYFKPREETQNSATQEEELEAESTSYGEDEF